ncbi:MAG: WD40/YVTN/BNR-like repeat-containing protein, partial [Blastocatellia bacterium]
MKRMHLRFVKDRFAGTTPASKLARIVLLLIFVFAAVSLARGVRAWDDNSSQENNNFDDILSKKLPWRSIGPAIMGGRIDDFAVVESNPSTIYVGAATGGIWKTTNNGTTWQPIFDNEGTGSIGDIAIAPSNPNIVWVGSGEANNRQSSSWGDGVYRSLDAGKTWQNMGLKDTRAIGRVVIDPHDPNVVYVAAGGHLWGPNSDRGVFKTSDGGKTWTKSLFIDEDAGVTDIAIDLQSPNTLYAAAYQRRRTAWGFNGGGPHSGIYKTIDGGQTWTKLTEGLPTGNTGRIGLDIYRSNPNIVYAVIENEKGGVFRSEDQGATWKKMSGTDPRPCYYSQIRIDPNNDQRVWVCGAPMFVSEDGGKTFSTTLVSKIHTDFHALWIDPSNSNHVLAGCDGGIHFSYDRGHTWDHINTIPLGQLYEVSFDNQRPYSVYGGLQDNGSWTGPSGTLNTEGITNDDWVRTDGGDGFYSVVDPSDPSTVYVESQQGNVSRLELKAGQRRTIKPVPPSGEPEYRFDWNTPIVVSPHNNHVVYLAGNRVFRSTDRGDTWTRSDDLSKQIDRDKIKIMDTLPDKNMLSRNDGQETYGQVVTLAESPMKEGLLYAGTDDGNVQVSRDSGKTWTNITANVPGLPANTYVSRVTPSRFSEGTAFVTFDGHRSDDYKPYIYMTTDYGKTWKSLRANLPDGVTCRVIREHPRNQNLLFLGTEFGAYVSFDHGSRWSRIKG